MRFEWDAHKAFTNFAKHGVSFAEATDVFYDADAVEGFDELHSVEENRFFIIGLSRQRLLFVVFAERPKDRIRIISARKAAKLERDVYERRIIQ